MATIDCTKCGRTGDRVAFRPFQNDLGRRVYDEICAPCWAEWLKHQQALINHYALNVQDAQAKEFLFQHLDQFLFQTKSAP
ncbi:MAG: oxidative damage protection protein [Gemmatimonadales bacterium]|nr:oxidative damage protection protein [Gemmatimonadales bacterium]